MSILLRIAERVLNRPLLVHPDKVPLILSVLEGRIPIENVQDLREAAEARIAELPAEAQAVMRGPAPKGSRFVGSSIDEDPESGVKTMLPYRRTADGVAVITVTGALINRGAWVGSYSGETSYEGIKHQVATAVQDPRAKAILLDIESPGGEAVGAMEAAAAVREAAKAKPVTAVVNGMAASAAYAIASGASRIVTPSTGISGSIGVVLLHADYSRFLDKKGITPTLIFSGAHKVDGNPFEPLPDSVRADLQAEVEQYYDLFVETVAAGRTGMSPAAIRKTEARIFIGQAAVDAGLADAVGTFEDALAELSKVSARDRAQPSSQRRTSMSKTEGVPGAETPATEKKTEAPAPAPSQAAPVSPAPAAEDPKARIKAILGCEEAKGREAQAQSIALETDLSLEQAKAVLSAAPKAETKQSFGERKASAAHDAMAGLGAPAEPKATPVKIDRRAIYDKRREAMTG